MKNTNLILIVIVISIGIPTMAKAQQKVILSNKKNTKEIIIPIDSRVGFITKKSFFTKTGVIISISDSTIKIGAENIQLNDLKFIGKRKKWTGLSVILLSASSGFLLGYYSFKSGSKKLKPIGLISSAVLFTFAIKISEKNKLRNVKNKWKIHSD